MEIFLLYLITRLDAFAALFTLLAILAGVGTGLGCLLHDDITNWGDRQNKLLRLSLPLFVVFTLLAVLIPSKNDALFIAAGVGVIEAARTDTAKRLASKSVQVIENYLDKQLKEAQ